MFRSLFAALCLMSFWVGAAFAQNASPPQEGFFLRCRVNGKMEEVFNTVTKHEKGTQLWYRFKDGTTKHVFGDENSVVGSPSVNNAGTMVAFDYSNLSWVPPTWGHNFNGSGIYVMPYDREAGTFGKAVEVITAKQMDWSRTLARSGYIQKWSGKEVNMHYNKHPEWTADDKSLVFVTNARSLAPISGFTKGNLEPAVADIVIDGENIRAENIRLAWYQDSYWAMHPTLAPDGRMMWATGQSHWGRDQRTSGIWVADLHRGPDARFGRYEPFASDFIDQTAQHFQTIVKGVDGRFHVVWIAYYNLNNNGFGSAITAPYDHNKGKATGFQGVEPKDRIPSKQLAAYQGHGERDFGFAMMPHHLRVLTWFATHQDNNSVKDDQGRYVGKVTHPRQAMGGVAVTYSGRHEANSKYGTQDPSGIAYQQGIYLIPQKYIGVDAPQVKDADEMVKIVDDPNFAEFWWTPSVPKSELWGEGYPKLPPKWKNDGTNDRRLVKGTPHSLIGADVFKRDVNVDFPPETHYTKRTKRVHDKLWMRPLSANVHGAAISARQGAVRGGPYTDNDIWGVRFWSFDARVISDSANPDLSRKWVYSGQNNRQAIHLGDVKIEADGSFVARVPTGREMTYSILVKVGGTAEKPILATAATGRTGHGQTEGVAMTHCGGCHGHASEPTPFLGTLADKLQNIPDLTTLAAKKKYSRPTITTIKPLLAKCTDCHNIEATDLNIGDFTKQGGELQTELTKKRTDPDGKPFHLAIARSGRESPIVWNMLNKRIDGWKNEDWDTDHDFTPNDRCKAHEVSTPDDVNQMITFIEAGVPVTRDSKSYDDSQPTLSLTRVAADRVIIGAWDESSDVTLDIKVDGVSVSPTPMSADRWEISVPAAGGLVDATVRDAAGNSKRLLRPYRAFDGGSEPPPPPDDELERLKAELAAAQAEIAKLKEDLAAALTGLQQAKDDLKAANTMIVTLQGEIVTLSKEVASLRGKITAAKAALE